MSRLPITPMIHDHRPYATASTPSAGPSTQMDHNSEASYTSLSTTAASSRLTPQSEESFVSTKQGLSVGSVIKRLKDKVEVASPQDVNGITGRPYGTPHPNAPRDTYYANLRAMVLAKAGQKISPPPMPSFGPQETSLLAWCVYLQGPNEPFVPATELEPESHLTAGYYFPLTFDAYSYLLKAGGSYGYLRYIRDTWVFWPVRDGKFCPDMKNALATDFADMRWRKIGPPPPKDPRVEASIASMFEQYIDQSMFDEDDPMTGTSDTTRDVDTSSTSRCTNRGLTLKSELYPSEKTEEEPPAVRVRWVRRA